LFESLIADAFGLVDADGDPVALAGADIRAGIVGRAAKLTLAQRFVNTEPQPIEAVYKFPLPASGAVCGFRVRVADRVIESVIEDRDEAFRRYDEALAAGHGGYLLDEERPNLYTVSVGNLAPGAEIVTEVDYVGLLEASGTRVRLLVPTTISPRYVPVDATEEQRRRTDATVNPAFALRVPYGLRLQLTIHDGDALASVTSPSHDLALDARDTTAEVGFAAGTVPMDRDVVIDIDYTHETGQRGYRCDLDDETFAQLDLSLPAQDAVDRDHEVVFVVDCSYSMVGSSIEQARQALAIMLRSLPEHARFNVIRFGDTFEQLFAAAEPYTAASAGRALASVSRMKADLGGTEMLAPLEAAMAKPPVAAWREVILLTDGEIANEDAVIRLVESRRERNRLFTVGIGYGPNEYFVRQVARTSGGLAVLIAPGERLEPPVLRLFNRAMSEPVTGLRLSWPGPVEQAPYAPAVHLGETSSIFARTVQAWPTTGTDGSVTLTGRVGDHHLDVHVPLDSVAPEKSPLPQLWARERIRDLEEGSDQHARRGSKQDRGPRDVTAQIVELSRRFGVISRHTSFVAIETRDGQERTTEQNVLRRVPVMLTHDWHGLGRFQHPSASDAYQAKNLTVMDVDASAVFGALAAGADPTTAPAREQLPPRPQTATDLAEATVLDLLALQTPDGGFPLTQVAELGEIPPTTLEVAARQASAATSDGERLVATAFALALLRARFPGHANLWEPLVRKSERFLTATLTTTPVTIDGQPLENWAEQLVTSSTHVHR
jgi:Ca-activated chloride channel homolog